MPGIEDKLVIRYSVPKGGEVKRILSRFQDVVEKIVRSGEDELVLEKTVILNRPDSRDEGVTTRYAERVDELLKELSDVTLSEYISFTPFNLPAYLDP